jgi:hypothetical protein
LTNFFQSFFRAESDSDAGASLQFDAHQDKNSKLLKQTTGSKDLLSFGTPSGRLWRRRALSPREEWPELEDDEHERDRDRECDRGIRMMVGMPLEQQLCETRRLSFKWLAFVKMDEGRCDRVAQTSLTANEQRGIVDSGV